MSLPDERCVRLALSQHGVITAKEAGACGMSMSAVQRRLQSGRWIKLHPGVYRLREFLPSWTQSLMGACLWAEGFASHRAAARLWKLGLDHAPVEIIAPTSTRGRRPLIVHRTDTLPAMDITSVDGIPVTSATRTLVDLGAVADQLLVERAVEAALRGGLTSLAYLSDRLEDLARPGRRGVGKLRSVLRARP